MHDSQKGFTLLELLVVTGILSILLAIVIIAINPFEQLNAANDTATKIVAQDYINLSLQYYTANKVLPWKSDSACNAQLQSGGTLADMPSCTHDLVGDSTLEQKYNSSNQLKDIYMTKCGDSAVLCYSPKSKVEYQEDETIYNKFGVNQPGCPGSGGPSAECFWCKPILHDAQCLVEPSPTPTIVPSPTAIPTPTPTPDIDTLYGVGGYKLDDTKFLRTYAVLAFLDPGIPPNWMIDVSFRPDFGGTTSFTSIGYSVNGVQATANSDTIFWVAYAGDGNFGSQTSPSYADQVKLTPKHFAFISMPYEWSEYVNGCGKKIYWRVVEAPNGGNGYYPTPTGPTYTNTVDCTTKVGVVTSWLDMNHDGVVDWTDYIIQALDTTLRYGGWQPPE